MISLHAFASAYANAYAYAVAYAYAYAFVSQKASLHFTSLHFTLLSVVPFRMLVHCRIVELYTPEQHLRHLCFVLRLNAEPHMYRHAVQTTVNIMT